jgi:hypothetical protein
MSVRWNMSMSFDLSESQRLEQVYKKLVSDGKLEGEYSKSANMMCKGWILERLAQQEKGGRK